MSAQTSEAYGGGVATWSFLTSKLFAQSVGPSAPAVAKLGLAGILHVSRHIACEVLDGGAETSGTLGSPDSITRLPEAAHIGPVGEPCRRSSPSLRPAGSRATAQRQGDSCQSWPARTKPEELSETE